MGCIDHDCHRFEVEPIRRTFVVSSSTYRAGKLRSPLGRSIEDQALWHEIERVGKHGNFAYGARNSWKQLKRENIHAGHCRVLLFSVHV